MKIIISLIILSMLLLAGCGNNDNSNMIKLQDTGIKQCHTHNMAYQGIQFKYGDPFVLCKTVSPEKTYIYEMKQ